MFQQMCMQPIPLKLNNLVKNNWFSQTGAAYYGWY
jgi:hypothetical protein